MARKLVGQSGTISFAFGAFSNGAIVWGTDTPLMAYVTNWKINGGVKDTDTSALGDSLETSQPLRGNKNITFDAMVPDTGTQFEGQEGTPIKVTFKPNAAATGSGKSYSGFISAASLDVPDGTQKESVTVKVGLNGA